MFGTMTMTILDLFEVMLDNQHDTHTHPRFRWADLNTEAAEPEQKYQCAAAVEPEKGQIQGHQRVDFGLMLREQSNTNTPEQI